MFTQKTICCFVWVTLRSNIHLHLYTVIYSLYLIVKVKCTKFATLIRVEG